MFSYRVLYLCLLIILMFATTGVAQSPSSSLPAVQGKVFDERGFLLPRASVIVTDANDAERITVTSEEGNFSIPNLGPGIYSVRAVAKGFDPETKMVEIKANQPTVEVSFILKVALEKEEVTVTSDTEGVSLAAEENAGALVLKGEDLDALPDDPDELADALQALAGPGAGPDGGQFYIDGFSGGRMPPKASIREIRINQNPFSSEFERLGFGRIEILTRPGTEKFRGEADFRFNDESLNSRNPYASTRAPFQARSYGMNLSGPVIKNRVSFFVDASRREFDENAVINATVLDNNLQPIAFNETLVTPQRRTSISPRVEVQLSPNNTLIGRYGYSESRNAFEGIGGFSLSSLAYDTMFKEHEMSLTETSVIKGRIINETRLRFDHNERNRGRDSDEPALRVLDSFYGGGSTTGLSGNIDKEWELQNSTAWAAGRHALKAGVKIEYVSTEDITRNNFAGTFTFAGGAGPELDQNNQPVLGADGQPVLVPLSSLERYRRTLLFSQLGMDPADIRALGGGATQFSLSAGNPLAGISQTQMGLFVNDDWRILPSLLLSFGVRYEAQNNISDHLDVAPRVAFAWSPGVKQGQRPSTIVRGGFGLFYDRVGESLVLEANRYNGINQQQFIVSNPDFFPTVPTPDQLAANATPQSIRRLSEKLNAPYSMQGAISVERQLPKSFTVSVSFVHTARLHDLRSFNINAPDPVTNQRPLGEIGNIFEYHSDGRSRQNQLIVGLSNRFSQRFTIFGNYSLGKAESNGESGSGSAYDPYDFDFAFARAPYDVRHRIVMGGSLTLPGDIRLNPFVMASSGRPFNITTGRDTNGDTLFTERPAYANDLDRPGVVRTQWGAFDPNPAPGAVIIPRNLGEGPGFLMTRLRLSKTIGFGKAPERLPVEGGPDGPPAGMWAGGGPGGAGGRGGGGGRGPGGPGGGRGFGGFGGNTGKPYNLTVSMDVSNVLNNTNEGMPIGNLTSPLFGISNGAVAGFGFRGGGGGGMSMAGNRRVEFSLRFSF